MLILYGLLNNWFIDIYIFFYLHFIGAVCSTPSTIARGFQKVTYGITPNYATIIEYTCDEAYELVGDPIIFCKSDSTWTNSVPTCKSKNDTLFS